MSTVFAVEEAVIGVSIHPDLAPQGTVSEILPGGEEETLPPVKRFGIADIWKIHSGKRNANIYPRRIN